jgi:hypothetical protein
MISARHCFSLEDFVVHIALPSLVKACNEGKTVAFGCLCLVYGVHWGTEIVYHVATV